MKGTLPITAECILESCEEQWRLVVRGILNELPCSILLSLPGSPDKKYRVQIIITDIMPPEHSGISYYTSASEQLSKDKGNIAECLVRTHDFVLERFMKVKWIFSAIVKGESKIPIIITYYPNLNFTVYSKQLSTDKKVFVPAMMN